MRAITGGTALATFFFLTFLLFAQEKRPGGARATEGARESNAKPFLGLSVNNSESGPRVDVVVPGYPAQVVGVRAGDLITALDGQRVKSITELEERFQAKRPGEKVVLEVRRDGRDLSWEMPVAESPEPGFNELEHRIESALKDRDVAALAGCFAPEADLVDPSGKLVQGRPAVEKYLSSQLAGGVWVSLKPDLHRVRILTNQVILIDGTWTSGEGSASAKSGHFTAVWLKTENGWLIEAQRFMAGSEKPAR